MGGSKDTWSNAAKKRAKERLHQTIKDPKTPSSYHRKKEIEDAMTDDFPRY